MCYEPHKAYLIPPCPENNYKINDITFSYKKAIKYGLAGFFPRAPYHSSVWHSRHVTFEDGYNINLPCGKCLECLNQRRNSWYIRCLHESYETQNNYCCTLTYNDANVTPQLYYRDFQLFMKRLRKKFGDKIKFFCAGEYGSQKGRVHWHCILFNLPRPLQLTVHKQLENYTLYRSKELADIWQKGFITLSPLTPKGCFYVVKYIVKASFEKDKYKKKGLIPPMVRMSLRTGLGLKHFLKYYQEYARDGVIKLGKCAYGIPRYYMKKYQQLYESLYEDLQVSRIEYFKNKKPVVSLEQDLLARKTICEKKYLLTFSF